ncbi:TonB family protein [Lysobacter enzymogenes]|uniref:energy transducer TonB n=1 Tax=Lysobacter enzymogenes TaxID=69 RepID=UPI0037483135
MKKTVLSVLLLGICSFANAQEIKTVARDLADEIGPVDLQSGVTQRQAGVIAQFYCRRHIAGCGPVAPAVERSSEWEVTPFTGIEGAPGKDKIVVSKRSGNASWGQGPALDVLALIHSAGAAPKPINDKAGKLGDPAGPRVKVQFVVSPDGATADVRFRQSSRDPNCDRRAGRVVEGWRFPPRAQPIELVATLGCGG